MVIPIPDFIRIQSVLKRFCVPHEFLLSIKGGLRHSVPIASLSYGKKGLSCQPRAINRQNNIMRHSDETQLPRVCRDLFHRFSSWKRNSAVSEVSQQQCFIIFQPYLTAVSKLLYRLVCGLGRFCRFFSAGEKCYLQFFFVVNFGRL